MEVGIPAHSCGSMLPSSTLIRLQQAQGRPFWRCQIPAVMLMSCMKHLAAKLPELHRLNHAATLGKTMPRQMSSIQGEQTCLVQHPFIHDLCLPGAKPHTTCFAGKFQEHAGPDISRLAPHLQQEWDPAANAHLGRIVITPQSNRKAWWSSGRCKTKQPHRWQARIQNRSNGAGCPYDSGKAVCPCNDLAHNHTEVAADWDWEANGDRTPETVTTNSHFKAAWSCRLCGHRWSATVNKRQGAGCPRCGREAGRHKTRQPSISDGAPHLLAEWDWEANERCGWHPYQITLGSHKKVHWVAQYQCKLGLAHRWEATPLHRISLNSGSPFPSGKAVCACNSLSVQCPEAADLWDVSSNGDLTSSAVPVQSAKVVAWKSPEGRQWEQKVQEVVINVRRQHMS